jgi:hypothetical protein
MAVERRRNTDIYAAWATTTIHTFAPAQTATIMLATTNHLGGVMAAAGPVSLPAIPRSINDNTLSLASSLLCTKYLQTSTAKLPLQARYRCLTCPFRNEHTPTNHHHAPPIGPTRMKAERISGGQHTIPIPLLSASDRSSTLPCSDTSHPEAKDPSRAKHHVSGVLPDSSDRPHGTGDQQVCA